MTLVIRRTATLEDRMHHLETLIQAIPSAVFAVGAGSLQSGPPGHPAPDGSTNPSGPSIFLDGVPSGVPPPSLHVFPLINPSSHFTYDAKADERYHNPRNPIDPLFGGSHCPKISDHIAEDRYSTASLTASYLYFDDEGYTRWQGEASGLPVLDLLVERHTPASNAEQRSHPESGTTKTESSASPEWFPNRQPRRSDVNPQMFWRLITSYIAPKLMDRCDHLICSVS